MDHLTRQIKTEQVRAIYRQLPTTITAIFGGAMLLFIFWDIHPHKLLINWFFLVITLHGVVASALIFCHSKYANNDLYQSYWNVFILLFSLFAGVVWGSTGVIFYSDIIEYQLFIIIWIWAMGAGMSALLVASKPAFYIMMVPLYFPLIIRLYLDSDDFHLGLSVVTFLWLGSIIYFHHFNQKTLLEAIRLRFHNVELVEELKKRNQEIERANLAKSQFLAAASHDLRQPLHAQNLFLAELDQYLDNPVARRIMGGLESSIYSMRKLLNSILDISKLDAGVVDPSVKIFLISPLLHELKSEFEPVANERGVELRMNDCSVAIKSDPVLLGSIVRNLIANAIRYSNGNKVLFGCRRRGRTLEIQVLDQGIGIPNTEKDDIFNPFVQLGNPERDREKGLGLGLSIVQRISDLLKHPVSVSSEVAKGTIFSIEVPIADRTFAINQKETGINDKVSSIKGKRILVIDDDQDIRTAMQGLLESWGCFPTVFGDISEALAHLDHFNEEIDLIISDYRLTDNNTGIQAIKDIRNKTGVNTAAVLITGDTSADRLREVKESGYPVLFKPVLAKDLYKIIGQVCR